MSGIEDLVAGAALGVAFQLLCGLIKDTKAKSKKFKPILERLESTLKLLTPKIIELEKFNKELMDNSREEIHLLLGTLKKARQLVFTCSDIPRWNKVKKCRYAKRLNQLDSSLFKLLNVEFQAAQSVDILRILAEVTETNQKLDRMNLHDKNNYAPSKVKSSNYTAGMPREDTEEYSSDSSENSSEGKPQPRFELKYKSQKKRSKRCVRIRIR
ncbi:hypothetical protein Pint_06791 [Pistacia integerrima]|uniref:Uncharacterized protein n=1 Tax=Pistacia integerrima TaxID=434235 RepID=A0ACC0XVB8_9ROSI|nr:hypothetical protein Pint_06791 [Pistacia integerrima]